MQRIAIPALCIVLLTGCANLQAPKFVDAGEGCDSAASKSMCLLNRLSDNYKKYTNDAQQARMVSDMTAIGATGGALIGAATNAHSDLYKATGGIALTAMGLSKYANFKTQALATRVAASKLTCAKAPLNVLITKAGLSDQAGDRGKVSALMKPGSVPGLTMVADDDNDQVIYVMGEATNIRPTDYLALANVVTTYDNATLNIDRATKILSQIDQEATTNLVGLQLSVINEIENDSFKLDEAMLILKPAPPAGVNPTPPVKAAFIKSQVGILEKNADAVEVIEAYERYTRCMQGKFEPTTF